MTASMGVFPGRGEHSNLPFQEMHGWVDICTFLFIFDSLYKMHTQNKHTNVIKKMTWFVYKLRKYGEKTPLSREKILAQNFKIYKSISTYMILL